MRRSPTEASTATLHVRITKSELAAWKTKAMSSAMTLSDWIRYTLNRGGPLVVTVAAPRVEDKP